MFINSISKIKYMKFKKKKLNIVLIKIILISKFNENVSAISIY